MLITVYTETKKKEVEKFVNNLFYGDSFIEWTYVVCAHWRFQCVPAIKVTEIKETYFEIYT